MAAEPTEADETADAHTLADTLDDAADDGVPTPEYDDVDAAALMEAEEGDELELTLEETFDVDGWSPEQFDVTATVELIETPHTCDRTCHVYVKADAFDDVKLIWTATGDVAGRALEHTDLRVIEAEEIGDENVQALDSATGHDVDVETADTLGDEKYRLTAESGRLIYNELDAIRGLGMEIVRIEGDQRDQGENEATVEVMPVDDSVDVEATDEIDE